MSDSTTISKTYRGTWKEILSLQEEIPETSEVEVKVFNSRNEEDEEEQARLHQILNKLFEEADSKEFTPIEGELGDITEAIVDKFRRKGFRE